MHCTVSFPLITDPREEGHDDPGILPPPPLDIEDGGAIHQGSSSSSFKDALDGGESGEREWLLCIHLSLHYMMLDLDTSGFPVHPVVEEDLIPEAVSKLVNSAWQRQFISKNPIPILISA